MPEKSKWDPEEIATELNSMRILVFMETQPLSNKYNQVILTPEQFKRVSFAVSTTTGRHLEGRPDMLETKTICSDEVYDLPDLQQISYETHGGTD